MNEMINPIRFMSEREIAQSASVHDMINPITHMSYSIPNVDSWMPEEQDRLFKTNAGHIYTNSMALAYKIPDPNHPLNYFILKSKRSYNSDEVRDHITHYLNYFIKYFDKDNELLTLYSKLKYLIDYEPGYSKESFIADLIRFILNNKSRLFIKATAMNIHNYKLKLDYVNKKNPVLQYNNEHAMVLMHISLLMIMIIPILTHYMSINNINTINETILSIYDVALSLYNIEIYDKLYETCISNVLKNSKSHSVLWDSQNIRGINTTTHAIGCLENILINIIPKYIYDNNIIKLNYSSILNNTAYQITDISYEYSFMPFSSSKRDVDNNSELDKYESMLLKIDEALFIQNRVNCEESMKTIEETYGPFDQNEVDFYTKELSDEMGQIIINPFQKNLVFNLFYKYFGDPVSIKSIVVSDYVKLLIITKRILSATGLHVLANILGGKVSKIVTRKNINKKEMLKIKSSKFYNLVREKYKNENIEKQILSTIAILLSSEFKIISMEDEEMHDRVIDIIPEVICEEVLTYISLI